ncbi:MAG: M20/M25/M40 family metallo-hydrolase [Chloroflexota bacterium]|jgi:putative selenium metabolism hydrolase
MDWSVLLEDCVGFARRLIQTPSLPGREGLLSELVAAELRLLDFDEVWVDDVGNVSGRMFGQDRGLGAIVLNSHLDHVDPGDLSLWPYPPYAAEIHNGRLYGRGACDIKGPMAVHLYSIVALMRLGVRPKRDVVFLAVSEEEVGGTGAVHWVENLDYEVDLVLLAEPSRNHVSLGHRGIVQVWVKFPGKSVHASVPDAGVNPNLGLAEFLMRLDTMKESLPAHQMLGRTTVAPTIIEVDTESMNVTPAWTRVLLDFRTAAMSPNDIARFVQKVAGELDYELSNAWAEEPDTPLAASEKTIFGFYTDPAADEVQLIVETIGRGMGWRPELRSYRFATDGRHFRELGAPIIGYSPGEEELAHTVDESISLEMMADSLRGHVELLRSY